jgi:trans-AT polyketide synthase, acyltransferase and oxidoreductase domains
MKVVMFAGQGSQYRGMGKELFKIYADKVQQASAVLGYDLEELCQKDPEKKLGQTAFTQPALYVVNALGFYHLSNEAAPDYLIGHSLGEYNALLAAGVFNFETGLKLVQKRGELMAKASGGGMAAILKLDIDTLRQMLIESGYDDIDIANSNTPSQIVVAGQQERLNTLIKDFDTRGIKIIPLAVSAPFHSRYMKSAAIEFDGFLKGFSFAPLQIPVIANTTAQPYSNTQIAELLSGQIASSVQWVDSIRLLMGAGVTDYKEIGGGVLTKMVNEIRETSSPIIPGDNNITTREAINIDAEKVPAKTEEKKPSSRKKKILAEQLGSRAFRDEYGIKYNYMAGAMYRGIASKELVLNMAKEKMLGFLGTAGMSLKEIEENILFIKKQLSPGEVFGMNLLHHMTEPAQEMKIVELYLKHNISIIEASAFMQITPALVYYRLAGLRKDENGNTICDHKIVAKLSRPEVADAFMRPAPEKIVNKLLAQGLVTAEQAALSKTVPVSYDICVEADSGGHTDAGVALVLLPSIQRLRSDIQIEYAYSKPIHIGLAGGIGTPQSAACAFIMGADFIVTGSINQCTVEAGTSDAVKDLLQQIDVQDTSYAPAGDMFEIGARVQVLKKGVLFPARANKLYELYNHYNSLEEIPEKTIGQLEKNYFKKSIDHIWTETKAYFTEKGEHAAITNAENNPKSRMALVFRWYFGNSVRLAFEGNIEEKVNFQIHTGPSLGAFNQWVKGTPLENWRNRHAGKIGIKMMEDTAILLEEKFSILTK